MQQREVIGFSILFLNQIFLVTFWPKECQKISTLVKDDLFCEVYLSQYLHNKYMNDFENKNVFQS